MPVRAIHRSCHRCCTAAATASAANWRPAMTQIQPKEGFNLSKWALDHPARSPLPSLMVVLMLLKRRLLPAGAGRRRPPFTFRAPWWCAPTGPRYGPAGGRAGHRQDRAHAARVPYAGKIRSFSKPGESQIIFQIKDSPSPATWPTSGFSVRAEGGRHALHPPQGNLGRSSMTTLGTCMAIYALESEGFQLRRAYSLPMTRAFSKAAARPMRPRSSCLACRTKSSSSRSAKALVATGPGHESRCSPSWASKTPRAAAPSRRPKTRRRACRPVQRH